MSITMISAIWALVLMISVNLWTYIPKQRPIPRHSDLYIAMSDQLMCSVTVQGGDVDVRPFDEVYKEQE